MFNSDLKAFCNVILDMTEPNSWLDERSNSWFTPEFGLCTNSGRFDQRFGSLLYTELENIFEGKTYPFNEDAQDYFLEKQQKRVYENPKRIAFLKKYAYGA